MVKRRDSDYEISVVGGCPCGIAYIDVPDSIDSGTTLRCNDENHPIVFDVWSPENRADFYNTVHEAKNNRNDEVFIVESLGADGSNMVGAFSDFWKAYENLLKAFKIDFGYDDGFVLSDPKINKRDHKVVFRVTDSGYCEESFLIQKIVVNKLSDLYKVTEKRISGTRSVKQAD